HAARRGVVLDLQAVRDPVAVDELGDLQARGAEEAVVDHATILTPHPNRFDGMNRGALGRPGSAQRVVFGCSPRLTIGRGSRDRRICSERMTPYMRLPFASPASPNRASRALRSLREVIHAWSTVAMITP